MRQRAAAVAGVLMAALVAGGAAAEPLDDLPGYWTGAGTVTLSGGDTERVKCAVVYKVAKGSGQIKQTLRCASSDYTINASAEYSVSGNQVEGKWEEKTYSATGDVSGRYSGGSFQLNIKGANFTAAMTMDVSRCKQSIQIRPKGLEVRRIAMSLSKC